MNNLKKVAEPLHVKELTKVNGIGPGIIKKLEAKLEQFVKEGNATSALYAPASGMDGDVFSGPDPFLLSLSQQSMSLSQASTSSMLQPTAVKRPIPDFGASSSQPLPSGLAAAPKQKRARKPKAYIPAYRSGGYAILVCLYERMQRGEMFMTKSDLVVYAQSYCDASFTETEGRKFYKAWSSMSTLIEKELVIKKGSPAKYYLTDEGHDLAKQLFENAKQFEGNMPAPANTMAMTMDTMHMEKVAMHAEISRPAHANVNAAEVPFQFWYLTSEKTRVHEKDAAEVKIDTERKPLNVADAFTPESYRCRFGSSG